MQVNRVTGLKVYLSLVDNSYRVVAPNGIGILIPEVGNAVVEYHPAGLGPEALSSMKMVSIERGPNPKEIALFIEAVKMAGIAIRAIV